MKKSIKGKMELLLEEMLDYALNLNLNEENIIHKRAVIELALAYLKIKETDEEGSFFQDVFDKKEQDLDEMMALSERFGITPKKSGRKKSKKIKPEEDLENFENIDEGGEL